MSSAAAVGGNGKGHDFVCISGFERKFYPMGILRETPFGTHFLNIRSLIGGNLARLLIEGVRNAKKRFATTFTIELNLAIRFDIAFEFFQEFIANKSCCIIVNIDYEN